VGEVLYQTEVMVEMEEEVLVHLRGLEVLLVLLIQVVVAVAVGIMVEVRVEPEGLDS
jgi:hypothetical protein